MTATGLERIADAFAGEGRRAALMPYMMGGFPTLDRSRQIAEAYIDAGADLIELGIPFSDPLADGPVIHAAATATLACGVTTADVLELAAAFADRVPVVVMAYANTVLAPGLERFLERLLGAGVAGMIVPDLPHEEGEQLAREAASRGLALVPLVAPTTTDERLARIGARASGFVYVVAVTGTTGERATQAGSLAPLVARAKGASGVPAAVPSCTASCCVAV